MWSNHATKQSWRRRVVSGALIVLGLAAVGLPEGRAQMRYSGGFVQYHRSAPPYTLRDMPSATTPSPDTTLPRSYSPDGDSSYPSLSAPTTLASRSYYSPEEPGRALAPFGVSAGALPWNRPGFGSYKLSVSSPSGPRKYALETVPLARENPAEEVERALLVVRLPENAALWVEGRQIALQGPTSTFRSPPLLPGKKYDYTVRAAWVEDGRWVSGTREVAVEAGLAQAVYLRPSSELLVQDKPAARIEAALAKLSPEDRAAVLKQRTCAVRKDVRLGEGGVPVKVTLKGKSVFVCSEGCVKKAKADLDPGLKKLEALRAKDASAPPRK